MAEDLMNTQTGGPGETIQLQPEVKTTPEQFDVNINPPVDSEPTPEEPITPTEPVTPTPQVATVPTEEESKILPTQTPVVEEPKAMMEEEPIKPAVTREATEEVKITTPQMYPSAMSSISSEMEMQRDMLGVVPAYKQNLDLLVQPEIDLINLGEPIITNQPPIETEEPIFTSEESRIAYEKEKEYEGISSSAVKNYLQEVENAKSNEQQQQKEAIAKLKNKPTQKYDDVLNNAAKFSSEKTYKDIGFDEEEYSPNRVSSNYNTFAEYTGLTNENIDEIASGMVGKSDDVALMMNNDFQSLDKTNDDISLLEDALKTGKYKGGYYSPQFNVLGEDVAGNKTNQYVIKREIEELKSRKSQLENKLQQSDYKILKEEVKDPSKTTPTKIGQFEKRVNDDLMKIAGTKWEYVGDANGVAYYKSPVKTIGNEGMGQMPDNTLDYKKTRQVKEDAKWLNRDGRELITNDVKNGTNKFFSSERFAKMDPGLIEYARDMYEIESKKNYEKTKKIDPYSYDGFKETARALSMESGTKMNNIIKSESETIVGEFNDLNNEWISKNRPKLNSTIDGIKKSMDQILTNDILTEIEKNPAAQSIKDKYTELLINEEDPVKDNQLKAQMYEELKTLPNISKSFNEYEKTLKNAVTKVQADYSKEYNAFRQDIYTNSVNKMKNAISKGAKEVYREGINNDLNIYQKSELQGYASSKPGQKGQGINYGANGVVQSKAFKEASFWGKRKMISDQWEKEKANIIYFTKAGIKVFPANDAERSKHFMDWTGQRKMTKEEQSQAWKELPERTGDDARNRYIFYAVDDLLESQTGKPTVFGIKTYAKEELDRIAFLEKKMGFKAGDHVGDFDKTRNKLPISEEEESQLLQTKSMLNKIMNHPETDQGFWGDLLNGFADGFEIPILGSVLGIQRNLRLGDALKKYQNNTFDSYDLSMVEAQASLNTLRSIKPPSFNYELGSGLGFTSTFMLEMAMFGGLNSLGRGLGVKVADAVTGIAKSSTDDVVRTAAANMTPEALTNVQKVTAFITGGVLEGVANPRAFEMTTKRMIDEISIQESGAYDNLIVQIDKQGEGGFEAFMKAYGSYIGMTTIERLGAHMPTSNVTKSALEYMGTSQFMKRTLVGRMMRSYGFRTVDEASDFLAANNVPWDNLLPEFGEEIIQSGWDALITGDEPVFGENNEGKYNFLGMDMKEAKLTALSVGIFGGGMSLFRNAKARVFNDNVVVETQDADGNTQIAQVQRDVWDKFNSAIGDSKITWLSALNLINNANLSPEQQTALSVMFAKTRGKEILEDPDYIKWKEENKGQVEEITKAREEAKKLVAESEAKLTDEQKAIRDYQFMTTGLQYDQEGKPLNYYQSVSAGGFFQLLNENEELLNNADMEVVTQTEDGKEETTNVEGKAEELASNSRKRRGRKGSKIKVPKTKGDVTEDETGVSSEVGEGQESVETQPIAETSKEEVSPGGVVQEEQKQTVQEVIDKTRSRLLSIDDKSQFDENPTENAKTELENRINYIESLEDRDSTDERILKELKDDYKILTGETKVGSEKSDIESIELKDNKFTAVYSPTNESGVFGSYTEAAQWIENKYKTKQETAPTTETTTPTETPTTQPTAEAKTEVKPTAETKPTTEKVEVSPGSYKAQTSKGREAEYSVKVNKDGTIEVKREPFVAPDGETITPKAEKASKTKTDSNGRKIIETEKGDTIYLEQPVSKVEEAPKEAPVKSEVEGKGKPTKVKIYAREPKLDDRGMPIISKFNQEVEFTKNKRTGKWETTDKTGNKIEATEDQAERAEKALIEQQKKETKPAKEKKKRAEDNLKAMQEQAEGVDEKEVAQGEDAEWAAEAAAEDTRPKEKKTKRGDKKSFLASQARGNSTELLQTLLDKFRKLFPNIAIVNDENAFNQKAYDLGRNPQSAAILSDGVIYLNPLVANNNTAFEEYSHIYLSVLEQANKLLYTKLIEETKKSGKEYMDEVLNDPAYADIHDNPNAVAFEAASKMVADRAEKIFDSARKNPLLDTIKRIWQNIADWFKVKSKLDINKDNLDDIVQKVAREINGNMSISSMSSRDLANIQNTNLRTKVKVNTKSIMNESSERAKWFRRNFLPYQGLREDVAQNLTKGRNDIAVFEQRSKAVIEDFNKGVSEYNKENGIESTEGKVEVLQKVNQALQDPVFRANWFAVDDSADELIKPHVETMRGMIDDLQKQLVESGLLTDDLEVSITGNMDMYVNTAYYAFSGLNEGNWLDLFTPQEQDQILDYVHETKYTPARELTYTIDNNGKVTAKFTNAYGVESESEIKLDNLDALKQFLGGTKRVGSKSPLNVDKLSFNTTKNKPHTIPFEFNGLDISSLGNEFGFKPNDKMLRDAINEIGRANQDLNKISDLIHGKSKLTGKQAAGATKRRKNLKDIQKLLLKEIKDPATNFMRTVAKQSNLLFNGQVEQAIIDSKYMANYGKPVGALTKQVNNPASRLNGYYVSQEMHDFLMGKTAKSLIEIGRSGVRALAGKPTEIPLSIPGAGFFNTGSAIAKAYVTIFSIGSNAANYFSGYIQLAKTGNLPIGMISAMRALEKSFEKIGSSDITKEDIAASFFNTVPTIIRGITKMAGETGFLKDGISPLTEDQKKFYGVSDYSQLSPDQKAKVLLEELISEGIINNNIDANVIQELTSAAFNNEAIPDELVKSSYEKIKNRVKGFGQSTMEAASNSYSFSDSMFKAIFYINEKKKNWNTYGSVMAQKGASMEEVERAMKERTAMAVKQQMPTYDRSPEFLKALSKFPLIGSFVQFDFQSKVNDKNILVDIYNMTRDSIQMQKEGFSKEASILATRAFGKTIGLGLSSSLSYGLYKIFNAAISGFSDDDDEAIASLQSEYRKNNQVLHLDGNKKGVHQYLDISRIDPQSAYFKYFNAFKRGGFDEGVEEVLKPYISPDIFAGAFIQTMSNLDKYGNVSKEVEGMNFAEKMKYLAEERILPSGTVGQITKIIDGFNQREVNEVSMNGWYELANTFLGAKPRSINIDKEIGNKLNYDHLKKIYDDAQNPLKTAIKDYDTKLDQFKRGKGGITQSELNDAKLEVELQNKEATEKANEIIGQARYMVDKYKNLGYNDDEIRKSLDDANTPNYLINLLMSDRDAVFDNEGNVVKGTFRRFKKPKSDLDLDLDMNLNLDLNLNME
jgi:hypothetical protein